MLDNLDLTILITKGTNPSVRHILGKDFDLAILLCTKRKIFAFINPLEYLNYKDKKENNITYLELSFKKIKDTIKKEFSKFELINIGIDFTQITLTMKKTISSFFSTKVKFFDCSDSLTELRVIKHKEEIMNVKQACKHTDIAFNDIITLLRERKFLSEKDIEKYIKTYAALNDLELAFNPVVASGKNAIKPHHIPEKKLNKGFCILDFGFKYNGYCSDMTRTFFLGKPTKEHINKYLKLKEIQEKALNQCVPNNTLLSVDNSVRDLLDTDKKYFIHSLGHGVGLEIHERPFFGSKKDTKFKSGMIVAIEPGIYDKFGIRIEDTIQISKNKPIVLTKSSKDLIIINKWGKNDRKKRI